MAPTLPPITHSVEEFVQAALAQTGKPYIFARKGPDAFDCSGLIIWDLRQLGYGNLPGDSDGLLAWGEANHTAIPLDQAMRTRGALLFRRGKGTNGHVVISLGNGMTIEAKGRAYGVGSWTINNRGFDAACLVPGLKYGAVTVGNPPASSGGGGGIGGALGDVTRVFTELADPEFWRRVGMVLGGAALILIGAGIVKGDVWGYVPLVGGQ